MLNVRSQRLIFARMTSTAQRGQDGSWGAAGYLEGEVVEGAVPARSVPLADVTTTELAKRGGREYI